MDNASQSSRASLVHGTLVQTLLPLLLKRSATQVGIGQNIYTDVYLSIFSSKRVTCICICCWNYGGTIARTAGDSNNNSHP